MNMMCPNNANQKKKEIRKIYIQKQNKIAAETEPQK